MMLNELSLTGVMAPVRERRISNATLPRNVLDRRKWEQRKLLPDIDHAFKEFEYHKVRVFEIGEHMVDASRLEAANLSGTAT